MDGLRKCCLLVSLNHDHCLTLIDFAMQTMIFPKASHGLFVSKTNQNFTRGGDFHPLMHFQFVHWWLLIKTEMLQSTVETDSSFCSNEWQQMKTLDLCEAMRRWKLKLIHETHFHHCLRSDLFNYVILIRSFLLQWFNGIWLEHHQLFISMHPTSSIHVTMVEENAH